MELLLFFCAGLAVALLFYAGVERLLRALWGPGARRAGVVTLTSDEDRKMERLAGARSLRGGYADIEVDRFRASNWRG